MPFLLVLLALLPKIYICIFDISLTYTPLIEDYGKSSTSYFLIFVMASAIKF